MASFDQLRQRMIEQQIAARGISDGRVLDAIRAVPRERFVPEHLVDSAYEDAALPIEWRQTNSKPNMVEMMIEAEELKPGDRVLEI